jgi:hypothetical protein
MLSVSPSWRKMGIGESQGLHLRSRFISHRRFFRLQDALDPPAVAQGELIKWEFDGSLTHRSACPIWHLYENPKGDMGRTFMARDRFQIRLTLPISGCT